MAPVLLAACATDLEQGAQRELDESSDVRRAAEARLEPATSPSTAAPLPAESAAPVPERNDSSRGDASLAHYVAKALEHSPALRAAHADWRASVHRIPASRRLPEPVLTYAYFVRSVETRVGPQRHRFGFSQAFPWPSVLSSGADAASLEARSHRQRFETAALMLERRVAVAYYELWRIAREREVQVDQQRVLQQLSSAARARIEVGQASFADVAQLDLAVARIADSQSALDERARAARAELGAAIGLGSAEAGPISEALPPIRLPVEDEVTLRSAAASHPRVRALALLSESRSEQADAASAERLPGFAVGVDYIETGPAVMPGQADSGKDPIIVMLSVKLPLWGGSYGAKEDAALAESQAWRAREAAARNDVEAEVSERLSRVRDSARRAHLYSSTLVPQAESAYAAVLGGYQTGTSSLASVLIAQRDLLDLQLARYRAHAEHAVAWAGLQESVGRPIGGREAS